MDLNKFAQAVTQAEGKKQSLSIAQVKEVIKVVFTLLGVLSDKSIIQTINRYRRNK